MKMLIKYIKNGAIAERELTAEELAELEKMNSEAPEPEPTPEERIKQLEEQLKAVTTILLGGDE